MARRAVVELVDDLDGTPAVQTVRFGYDDRNYEIELSEAHASELDEFLAPYLEHARRVSDGGRAGRRRRPARQPRKDTQAIRGWAREHGYQVSDRGRIPTDVATAYQTAHG